jgi:hypothetical protein
VAQSDIKIIAMRMAGSYSRHGADAPETLALRNQLNEAKIAAYITKTLESAPPFSDEQVARLSVLLRPSAGE